MLGAVSCTGFLQFFFYLLGTRNLFSLAFLAHSFYDVIVMSESWHLVSTEHRGNRINEN